MEYFLQIITTNNNNNTTVSQYNFYFCDNFPNCKPMQITFGRNKADKICNKLTGNFDIRYASLVYIVKWHQFFS